MKLLKTVLFLGYSALQCPCSSVCSDTACECRTVPKDYHRAFCKGRQGRGRDQKGMLQEVEVGGYNLPENVLRSITEAEGKYLTADVYAGDYIVAEKVADEPAAENKYLYNLNGEKQAISITISSFAEGLSGKLKSGDIVSVIAPDYLGSGETVIPAELKYVEVIAVTAKSGYDANTQEQEEEKELPSTVTVLVRPEQSRLLARLEAEGEIHLSLVYRGDSQKAAQFIEAQDLVLEELLEENTEEEEVSVVKMRCRGQEGKRMQ